MQGRFEEQFSSHCCCEWAQERGVYLKVQSLKYQKYWRIFNYPSLAPENAALDVSLRFRIKCPFCHSLSLVHNQKIYSRRS
jgi:hypothetical protein